LNATPVPRQPSSDAHALDAVAPVAPSHPRGELCPYGHFAYKWLDERDLAIAKAARAAVELKAERTLRKRAETRLRALTGPRPRHSNRATIKVEVRSAEAVAQHVRHLADEGGATRDQLLALAEVLWAMEDHAATWSRAAALTGEAAS
jgi:glycerol-3-phosphate dehydrogenase